MNRRKKLIMLTVILVQVGSAALWLRERLIPEEVVSTIERTHPGEGNKDVLLEVWDGEKRLPVKIQVHERVYGQEELEKVFEQAKLWLDEVWLGDNSSPEAVSKKLNLPTEIEKLGLHVQWVPENYQWVQSDGTITEKAFLNAPVDTRLCAVVQYRETERRYDYEFTIIEENKSAENSLETLIKEAVKNVQDEEKSGEKINLPTVAGDRKLQWYMPKKQSWMGVFILGNLFIILWQLSWKEKKIEKQKKRQKCLKQDYPDIVYRMILFISSGMTVRCAWDKTVLNYRERRKKGLSLKWGYEEMIISQKEMNYGISELKAYENFGRRCGLQNYIRFASLLIQQVRRGAKGMNQLLIQEVMEAEILRRENARKKAEEAGTKLLFPMILLMTVVFAVLLIPAFLSLNL